ncbi:PfkB family carbohydrate kinase [Mammaliicoccus lentus]|uniref:PfkB family carbohydrate kinase n=1 Tax=Mammaliicoccus lentus TaxID=42858 RepID=UPI001C4F2DF4|nr:PfkB family carbohydrate kinase [Mammaliicoccus lentus]MBW0767398.1 ribokinase [Mammaliicoccus lentus]
MTKEIITLGSINQDIFVNTKDYPKNGETVWVDSVNNQPGGKGANQAIALTKIGGKTKFIGAVGVDAHGENMIKNLQKHGVDTEFIVSKKGINTGTFIVILDSTGENTMLGTLGANNHLNDDDIIKAFDQTNADYLLLQLETSKTSIMTALKIAKEKNIKVVLDPAPADGYDEEFLKYAYLITPNQQEAEAISGIKVTDIESAERAAHIISQKGVENVIVKLGSQGSLIYKNQETTFIQSHKVSTINTVGAGDVFAAAITVCLNNSQSLIEAVEFATAASAIKVSKKETQEAIPSYSEIQDFVKKQK